MSIPIAKQMTKTFNYKSYDFVFTVIFNTKVEKKIGGKRLHTIEVNCPILMYKKVRDTETLDLVKNLAELEKDCTLFIEENEMPTIEMQLLTELGFH